MDVNAWPGITSLNAAARGQAAQAYAGAGLPVFPVFWAMPGTSERLVCSCGDSTCDRPAKHPLVRWKSEASADRGTVTEWWAQWPEANIGIPTGPASNLLVLDLDRREIPQLGPVDGRDELERWCQDNHVPWPIATLEQRTGGGGSQLFLRHVEGARTLTAWLPGVDVRADGGYVLAPSSGHISGGTYQWLNELGPAATHERLAAVLRVARGHQVARNSDGQIVEYDYALAKLEGPPPGARDHFFNALAFELRTRGVGREDAEHKVMSLWERTDHESGGGFPLQVALEKVARVWRDVAEGEGGGGEQVSAEQVEIARRMAEQHALSAGGERSERVEDGSGGRDVGSGIGGQSNGGNVVQGPWANRPWVTNEPPTEDLTDTGNAYRLRRLLGDRVRYVHGRGWHYWDETRWRLERNGEVRHLAREVAAEMLTQVPTIGDDGARKRLLEWAHATKMSGRHAAMLKEAESLPGLSVDAMQLDVLPHILNTPAGEVDLRTGVIGPHAREHLLTRCTAAVPGTVGSSTHLEFFFATFMPDPAERAYLMRVLGSCLWAGNRFHKMLVIHGDTISGKTTMSDMLEWLGDYVVPINHSVLRGSQDDKPRPDLLDTYGARIGPMLETSEAWDLHVDMIKKTTGGDVIKARGMHSNEMIRWKPTFTPLFIANVMPTLKGIDPAMKRRILALPFTHNLPLHTEDKSVKDALLADPAAPGAFLGELIAGALAQEAMRPPRLEEGMPHRFALGTMALYEEMDEIAGVLASMLEAGWLVRDEGAVAHTCPSTAELYLLYSQWVMTYGSNEAKRNRLGIKHLSQRLESLGWVKVRSNGTRWVGWRLRDQASDRDL